MHRVLGGLLLIGGAAACATPAPPVRVATFNIQELSTAMLLDVDDQGVGRNPQARAAAGIIQRLRPDILLLNEIDHDYEHPDDLALNARRFVQHYLGTGPHGIEYRWAFAAPNNTGLLSGLDLDGNGVAATGADVGQRAHGDDSYGFGLYPGQYSMALLSRYPIDTAGIRTFQRFLWRDLPDNVLPTDFYPDSVARVLRLSSKSHWDVPVLVGRDTVHLLASHPTPPVFDGPEDRNGRRNFDEVGFWLRYLDGSPGLRDDAGRAGGLRPGALFVILGDLNAYPGQAESVYRGGNAISQLLRDPRIQDPEVLRDRNTAAFAGGVRVDYVLPGRGLEVLSGGVARPDSAVDAAAAARARLASDHNLVWLDLRKSAASGAGQPAAR